MLAPLCVYEKHSRECDVRAYVRRYVYIVRVQPGKALNSFDICSVHVRTKVCEVKFGLSLVKAFILQYMYIYMCVHVCTA